MAGVDYEPSVGWTPDALIGELEQRVEMMAGALAEVRELLRRLAAERALQQVLSQQAAAAVPVATPNPEMREENAPEPFAWTAPVADLATPEPVLDELVDLAGAETPESATPPEVVAAVEMPVSAAEHEPPAIDVTKYAPETPAMALDALPAPQSPSYHDLITDVPAPEDDDFDVTRDEVRRAVELMRSEIESGYYGPRDQGPLELEGQTETYDDDIEVKVDPATVEAAREEVRRAVEQARRDLARGTMPLGDFNTPATGDAGNGHVEFRTHVPTGGHAPLPSQLPEASHFDESRLLSPSIVIEDMQGRVELVRVFDTLSRVNCAGQAVLLNYTPYSVTVGLGMNEAPDKEELAEAVRQVFGRPCSIVSEGARLAVTLNHGRAA